MDTIKEKLTTLYGESTSQSTFEKIIALTEKYRSQIANLPSTTNYKLTQKQCVLIAYPDHVSEQNGNEAPLQSLHHWCTDHLTNSGVSTIHVLPFHPSTSYDGYSIKDYHAVDEHFGNWSHLNQLQQRFGLMFDIVLNHCSASHPWFTQFLHNEEPGRRYFITEDPSTPWLANVRRARDLPLLHPHQVSNGTVKHVWTTYSPDLIDVNWAEPDVLCEFLEIMLASVAHGADILRLDAYVYVWKELYTNCVNQPKNHVLLSLLRDVLEFAGALRRACILPSITNVTQDENYAYFNSGADLLYLLPLSGLLLYSLYAGDIGTFREWLRTVPAAPPGKAYLNLTACHDGVGLSWLRKILTTEQLEQFISKAEAHGALLSTRGSLPWELNGTYYHLCGNDPEFLATQSVMLCLRGVPALYFASCVRGRNDLNRVADSGDNRAVNRGRYTAEYANSAENVNTPLLRLTRVRSNSEHFHPFASQEIIATGSDRVFGLRRNENVVCLTNFSPQEVHLSGLDILGQIGDGNYFWDMVAEKGVPSNSKRLILGPYEFKWIERRKYPHFIVRPLEESDQLEKGDGWKVLHLLRHGEAAHHAKVAALGITGNPCKCPDDSCPFRDDSLTDSELSEHGIQQSHAAAQLALNLRPKPEKVICSASVRTLQTTEIVFPEFWNSQVVPIGMIRESNLPPAELQPLGSCIHPSSQKRTNYWGPLPVCTENWVGGYFGQNGSRYPNGSDTRHHVGKHGSEPRLVDLPSICPHAHQNCGSLLCSAQQTERHCAHHGQWPMAPCSAQTGPSVQQRGGLGSHCGSPQKKRATDSGELSEACSSPCEAYAVSALTQPEAEIPEHSHCCSPLNQLNVTSNCNCTPNFPALSHCTANLQATEFQCSESSAKLEKNSEPKQNPLLPKCLDTHPPHANSQQNQPAEQKNTPSSLLVCEELRARCGPHMHSKRFPRATLEQQFPSANFGTLADCDPLWTQSHEHESREMLDARLSKFLDGWWEDSVTSVALVTHFTTLVALFNGPEDDAVVGVNENRSWPLFDASGDAQFTAMVSKFVGAGEFRSILVKRVGCTD